LSTGVSVVIVFAGCFSVFLSLFCVSTVGSDELVVVESLVVVE